METIAKSNYGSNPHIGNPPPLAAVQDPSAAAAAAAAAEEVVRPEKDPSKNVIVRIFTEELLNQQIEVSDF